jgi:peptide/nickel transport system permease protein
MTNPSASVSQSPSRAIWQQLASHRGALISLSIFLLIIAMVMLMPLVWPYEANAMNIRERNQGMSWQHPFGTNQIGRDIFARMMEGGQTTIAVGLTAMLVSLGLGVLIGVLAGYFKRLDGPLMRLTELFQALPLLPLLLVMVLLFREMLSGAFGADIGIFILIVTGIGVTSWMPTAWIVRADVLALKEREFILAAHSVGTTARAMIFRHILPNVMSSIMVSATLGIANAIITESILSFLGLGFPPDYPTWGRLLQDGTDYLQQYPERVFWPGLMISLTVLCVNYMGDGLRDAFNPRAGALGK